MVHFFFEFKLKRVVFVMVFHWGLSEWRYCNISSSTWWGKSFIFFDYHCDLTFSVLANFLFLKEHCRVFWLHNPSNDQWSHNGVCIARMRMRLRLSHVCQWPVQILTDILAYTVLKEKLTTGMHEKPKVNNTILKQRQPLPVRNLTLESLHRPDVSDFIQPQLSPKAPILPSTAVNRLKDSPAHHISSNMYDHDVPDTWTVGK